MMEEISQMPCHLDRNIEDVISSNALVPVLAAFRAVGLCLFSHEPLANHRKTGWWFASHLQMIDSVLRIMLDRP